MSQQPITASLQSVQLCLLLLEYRLCDGYTRKIGVLLLTFTPTFAHYDVHRETAPYA